MQDFVSAPFIKAPSEHQDLNWSQTGVILWLGGSTSHPGGLAETRNRHLDNRNEEGNAKKIKGNEKRCSATSPAPPCSTHPSDTAGHSWLWRTWHLLSQKPPNWNARAWQKPPATPFCRKISFISSTASRRQELQQARREHLPWESQAEQEGSCAGSKCWLMLLITQELPVKILPWSFLLNLGSAPIFSPWHVINAHYHQDLGVQVRLGLFSTQALPLPTSQIPAQ